MSISLKVRTSASMRKNGITLNSAELDGRGVMDSEFPMIKGSSTFMILGVRHCPIIEKTRASPKKKYP